jgi:hypothetical protein
VTIFPALRCRGRRLLCSPAHGIWAVVCLAVRAYRAHRGAQQERQHQQRRRPGSGVSSHPLVATSTVAAWSLPRRRRIGGNCKGESSCWLACPVSPPRTSPPRAGTGGDRCEPTRQPNIRPGLPGRRALPRQPVASSPIRCHRRHRDRCSVLRPTATAPRRRLAQEGVLARVVRWDLPVRVWQHGLQAGPRTAACSR